MPALATTSLLTDLHADVWHAHALAAAPVHVQPTGNTDLDAQLPGGGWPVGAMTEVLQPTGVHSEWRLLLPALVGCGQGPVVLVGAPQAPFAPSLDAQGLRSERLLWITAQAMAQRLWAAEQALRCAAVDAVLVWFPRLRMGELRADHLRRLQMAAAGHSKLLFVMRDALARKETSPAVLRLEVLPASQNPAHGHSDALEVRLHKRRGPPHDQPLHMPARAAQLTLVLAASRAHVMTSEAQSHALDRIQRG